MTDSIAPANALNPRPSGRLEPPTGPFRRQADALLSRPEDS
jgi:hypothetical protein